jgi:hypothetical protein
MERMGLQWGWYFICIGIVSFYFATYVHVSMACLYYVMCRCVKGDAKTGTTDPDGTSIRRFD